MQKRPTLKSSALATLLSLIAIVSCQISLVQAAQKASEREEVSEAASSHIRMTRQEANNEEINHQRSGRTQIINFFTNALKSAGLYRNEFPKWNDKPTAKMTLIHMAKGAMGMCVYRQLYIELPIDFSPISLLSPFNFPYHLCLSYMFAQCSLSYLEFILGYMDGIRLLFSTDK